MKKSQNSMSGTRKAADPDRCAHCLDELYGRREQDANGDWFCAECAHWLKYASERRRRP